MTKFCGFSNAGRVCLLVAALPVSAQVKQDRPELCGKPGETVVLPPNITATSFDTRSTLTIRLQNSVAQIEMPGVSEVREVCPISQGKLLAFGWLDLAYSVYVLDEISGTVSDVLTAYTPVVSPDRRWLAFRDFYPPQSEVSVSEEYLLYDFSKSAAENRVPGVDRRYIDADGRVMYPAVPNNAPFDHLGLPDRFIHQFRSDSLYWAPDSTSLVFADSVLNQLSIVWVRIGANGAFISYVHPVSTAEVCEAPPVDRPNTLALTLSGADVTPAQNNPPEMRAHFRDGVGGACKPKALVLHESDFKQAEVEQHAPPPAKKPAQPAVRR